MSAKVERARSSTRVGSALVLTDGLQINHRENLSDNINLHLVGQRVRHSGMPVLKSGSLGRLGLHLEVISDLTLSECHNILEVFSLLLSSRQRSDILLDEWTKRLLVEVTNEDKGELAGVLETILGNLQDAVVVDILQILYLNISEAGIMRIDCIRQRIREDALWIQVLILQSHLQRSQQVLELLLVLVDCREVEILHLHHGLDVLRC